MELLGAGDQSCVHDVIHCAREERLPDARYSERSGSDLSIFVGLSVLKFEMLGRSRLLACKCVRDIVIGIESDLLACNCVRDIVIWIGSDLDTNVAASFVPIPLLPTCASLRTGNTQEQCCCPAR